MQTAQEFYGKHYDTAAVPSKLDEAFKWLTNAIRYEDEARQKSEPIPAKVEMALKTACKREYEGFGIAA